MPLDEHSADRAAAGEPGSEPPAPPRAVAPAAASRAQIDVWVAEGRYAEAAAALRTCGELAAAQELLERIWDYPAALAVATERGDLLAQLRLCLLSGELTALSRLQPALVAASVELRRRAAALLEQHQQPAAAAALYEAAGDLSEALRCYEQADHHQGSARLYERQGEPFAAVRAYERLLAASTPHDPGQQVLALRPELVIFGSGARQRFLAPALYRALIDARVGLETMDTAAACRTYNVLVAERRPVLAALLIEAPEKGSA